jgi:glycosyltransferase involved in cell wall biosynthesis
VKKVAKSVKTNSVSTARVSVIVPVFNHEAFVHEAVMSALSQSHSIFELIAIDDGSSDGSLEQLKSIAAADERVKLLSQRNRGASATINRGLSLAQGDWLAILNSDDRWHPHRLSRLLDLASRKAAQVIFSRCCAIDHQGRELEASHPWQAMYADLMHSLAQGSLSQTLCIGNPVISTSNFVFHRHALNQIGPLRHRRFVADWDWALRAVLTKGVQSHWSDDALFEYRLHASNTIAGSGLRSSMEIAHMFSSLQRAFPDQVEQLEQTRRRFTRDIRKHAELSAYARGQHDTDHRHQSERERASEHIENLEQTLRQEREIREHQINELESILNKERELASVVRATLESERDEARSAQQASHESREKAISEFSEALEDAHKKFNQTLELAHKQRDDDLAQLRDAYEHEIIKLQTILNQERELSSAVRAALESERDEARAAQQASHQSREEAIKEFSEEREKTLIEFNQALEDAHKKFNQTLELAHKQRDDDLAQLRDAYEHEIIKLQTILNQERELGSAVRTALESERDEARIVLNETSTRLAQSDQALEATRARLEETERQLKYEQQSRLGYQFRKLWIRK